MNRSRIPWALFALFGLAVVLAAFNGGIDAGTSGALLLAEGALAGVDMDALKKELQRITDSVKEEGAKALAQVEKHGTMAAQTKDTVDKLLTDQGGLKTRLDDLEQKIAKGRTDDTQGAVEDSLDLSIEKAAESMAEFGKSKSLQKQVVIPINRKALTNTGVTGTALTYPGTQIMPQPLQPLLRRLTIRDVLASGRMSGAVLFYQRETGFTNNAAPVSEGSLKPKSDLTFELITEPVRTIAHMFDVSLQMLSDVPYIQSYIASRGMYGLKLVEEAQLLTGSGTGQNLEGIYTAATAYNLALDALIPNATATDIDKLRLALLQVELANAFADTIALHPSNWAVIELLKDSQLRYVWADPTNTNGPRLWGRRVLSTQAMTQNTFLVGDFAAHAQIFDRQDANIAISFENKDNFERNMATIRIEERLALAIYRPEAFIKGTLESAS